MVDVKVIEGKLFNCNMLVVEEENNEKLMERIVSMLKHDINNYQKKILLKAIEEIKIIKKITKSA